MKIEKNGPQLALVEQLLKAPDKKSKGVGTAAGAEESRNLQDRVELSKTREEANWLKVQAQQESDVREEKVQRIREELLKGVYKVEPRDVARALLKDHLTDELL